MRKKNGCREFVNERRRPREWVVNEKILNKVWEKKKLVAGEDEDKKANETDVV